jgi:hypothetical protein
LPPKFLATILLFHDKSRNHLRYRAWRTINLKIHREGMRMTKSIGLLTATAFAILAFTFSPSTAAAQSFSGNWPITWNVTFGPPRGGTFTYCLTLTDDGSAGFPHSGSAVLNGSGETNLAGLFQVINNQLVATFYFPGGYIIDPVVFVVPVTSKGNIGKGFGETPNGAYTANGPLVFGKKNGCGDSQ